MGLRVCRLLCCMQACQCVWGMCFNLEPAVVCSLTAQWRLLRLVTSHSMHTQMCSIDSRGCMPAVHTPTSATARLTATAHPWHHCPSPHLHQDLSGT